jgi:hypothetical protein
MAIRVALIGTGNCGGLALKQLVNDARFDLTGVWVSSDVKVGKDAGELAHLDVTTGVAATNGLTRSLRPNPTASCTARWAIPGCPTPWPMFARSSPPVSTSSDQDLGCCSTRGRYYGVHPAHRRCCARR